MAGIVAFYRGVKAKYNKTTHANGIYFCTDTLEVLMNEKSYGGGISNIEYNNTDNTINITLANGTIKKVTLPEASATIAGLMSKDDYTLLHNTAELVVKLHAVINASVYPSTIYKGENTNVNINHSATFDGNPLTYTLKVDGNTLTNPYSLSDTKTFNIVFEIDNADPKLKTNITRTAKVNAYYPRYYGPSNKTTLTSADVLALTKMPVSSSAAVNNRSFTYTGTEYLWLCVPEGMNVNSVLSSGFGVPMEAPVTVAVTGKGNYKCYRSTSKPNAGTVTYNIA